MRRGLFALLFSALPVMANEASTTLPSTTLDVAPTTLELKPGAAGLFFITNHGARPVTVQIEAADWRQENGRDITAPSQELLASPPLAHIAPGARQSVRVMARPPGDNEHAYRLLVSELPDPAADPGRVKVLLQFSVPVFAAPDDGKGLGTPLLSFSARRDGAALVLSAVNRGPAPVKLAGPTFGGVLLDRGPVYLLPGARRDFTVNGAASLHVTAHDALSGRDFDTDVTP